MKFPNIHASKEDRKIAAQSLGLDVNHETISKWIATGEVDADYGDEAYDAVQVAEAIARVRINSYNDGYNAGYLDGSKY